MTDEPFTLPPDHYNKKQVGQHQHKPPCLRYELEATKAGRDLGMTESDGKLGGAWEQGYLVPTGQDVFVAHEAILFKSAKLTSISAGQ